MLIHSFLNKLQHCLYNPPSQSLFILMLTFKVIVQTLALNLHNEDN